MIIQVVIIIIILIFFLLYIFRSNVDTDYMNILGLNDTVEAKKWVKKSNSIVNEVKGGKKYNLYNGYQEYILGDIIMYNKEYGTKHLIVNVLKNFPNSIASKYWNRTNKTSDIKMLWKILKEIEKVGRFEKPPENSIVLHLRVGDVCEKVNTPLTVMLTYPTKYKNKKFYVVPLKYIQIKLQMLPSFIKKIIIVAGSHLNMKSYKRSSIYINSVKYFLETLGYDVTLRLANSPDDDFIYMSNSKYFINSEGNFSNVIRKMVIVNNGVVSK